MTIVFLVLLSTSIQGKQWYIVQFSSLVTFKKYPGNIHYQDIFRATIMMLKFLLSFSTNILLYLS